MSNSQLPASDRAPIVDTPARSDHAPIADIAGVVIIGVAGGCRAAADHRDIVLFGAGPARGS